MIAVFRKRETVNDHSKPVKRAYTKMINNHRVTAGACGFTVYDNAVGNNTRPMRKAPKKIGHGFTFWLQTDDWFARSLRT